ncbi:MFS transporter [Oculatella sp. LEGE 06141]|uniref:MFS transporter n=1 Tax=Oculatella sp. LEGE 06141 TaxID=1828648 RepID=UPI001881172F|nr:MFS transporter [Oculatella sp. LEGE 06141]MBE9178279.1 MFS transporter [Oculatella sp. LEGE 06141]
MTSGEKALLNQSSRYLSPQKNSKLPTLLVLLVAGCLTTMTGGVVSPVLPEIVLQLQLDPRWAGTLVSMHALMIAVFTPLLGILADRVGKLRVLLPALLLYAVCGVAGGFMNSLVPLLASRALLGVASGGIAAASIGLLGNLYSGEARSRVLGYATSAMTTASILIPLLGGWVGSFGWRYAFYLYGLSLPTALFAALILQDNRSKSSVGITADEGAKLTQVLRKPQAIRLYLTLLLAAAIVYSVVIYTPLYLKEVIGAGPALNGCVLAVRAIGAAIVSAVLATRLAKRLGTEEAIALGFCVMAVTLATIPFLHHLHWILPTAVLFGMGFGVVVPNVYDSLASLAPSELRASVLAIGTGLNSMGQFLSPLFLGPVWKYSGLTTVFYVAAGVAVASALLSWFPAQKR